MAFYKRKNFIGKTINAITGDVFEDCNFSQSIPGTVISSVKGLTFRSCNLTNVSINPNWTVNDCNTFQGIITPNPLPGNPVEEEATITAARLMELNKLDPAAVTRAIAGKITISAAQAIPEALEI